MTSLSLDSMIWIIILLLIAIAWIIWKIVIIPSVSVTTDKDGYDRSETAHISGNLVDQNSQPIAGKTVSIAIEPPSGDAYGPFSALTGADGSYAYDWEIPDDAVGGTYTVSVSALGSTAAKTFTQMIRVVVVQV